MRHSFLLFFFCCFAGALRAQSFAVELAGGPTMAYRITSGEKEYKDWFDDERPMLSYDVGFRLIYSVNEQWSAGAGLAYSRKGFNWGAIWYTDDHANLVRKVAPNHVFTFFELPVFGRYFFKKNDKFQLYAQFGLATALFFQERVQAPFSPEGELHYVVNKNSSAIPINIGVQAGVGMLIRLNNYWRVGAEPLLSSHLLSLYGDVPVQRRLFALGLHVTVNKTW